MLNKSSKNDNVNKKFKCVKAIFKNIIIVERNKIFKTM